MNLTKNYYPYQSKIGEYTKEVVSLYDLYDIVPDSHATKLIEDACPQNLNRGQVVYLTDDVRYYLESTMKKGTPVTFTRYLYSKLLYDFPIYKRAFFYFPDGSERSLNNTSFTLYNPNSYWRRFRKFIKSLFKQ